MSISNKDLARRLRRVESRNITYVAPGFPIFWERARGARVLDAEGRTYLDLTAAFGVAGLGHTPPALQKVIASQTRRFWHGMGDVHPSRNKVELLELLAKITPGRLQKSILSSSGSEAVESALKTARLYTGKPGVLAFEGAYHGLTYGSLAATHGPEFSKPFRDQLASFVVHAPYPDTLRGPSAQKSLSLVDELLRRTPAIGAILIEPLQARGGIRIPPPSFLKELQALGKRRGVLLILDEIYTGFGRTGRMFASEHSRVVPDLLCLGKAMANGYPISVCIGTPEIMQAWPESDGEAIHTSTFLGNPLGCAMALASIKEAGRLQVARQSRDNGAWWLNALKKTFGHHPNVGEIRGRGLMVGIEFVKDRHSLEPHAELAGRVVREALQRGLLLLSGGHFRNVLCLTPPLVIRREELTKATRILKESLYGTTTASR